MRSQCQAVRDYLAKNGSITQAEALDRLGVARLASRIHDLRNMGEEIIVEPIYVLNRFGEEVKVARYHLMTREEVAA
jgi:hypothetical protein